ncbi:hypothetical protein PHMEG_00011709 [Phytophthora megakarya]|uniref:Uncharacterized protein n=1 Tax=Phytophthora megakarya TaxID=4795 RepID=A0A225WAL4_9STRA|nr:hypothetical protein PHMEG_00011709 [Phytophthora megakarya]
MTLYHWYDWIIMGNRQLSMCENQKTGKYTNLNPVSFKTFKTYMIGLEGVVQGLSYTFATGKGFCNRRLDRRWNGCWPVIAFTKTEKFLLCFSVHSNESAMSSAPSSNCSTLHLTPTRLMSPNCASSCVHVSVNVAIAKTTKVSIIGCTSYRFNLAVQEVMREHREMHR